MVVERLVVEEDINQYPKRMMLTMMKLQVSWQSDEMKQIEVVFLVGLKVNIFLVKKQNLEVISEDEKRVGDFYMYML
jgi:esterase/lipase superfamily enzyme